MTSPRFDPLIAGSIEGFSLTKRVLERWNGTCDAKEPGPRRRTGSETVAVFPDEPVFYGGKGPAWIFVLYLITYRAEAERVGQSEER